jgi:hypothetical protein
VQRHVQDLEHVDVVHGARHAQHRREGQAAAPDGGQGIVGHVHHLRGVYGRQVSAVRRPEVLLGPLARHHHQGREPKQRRPNAEVARLVRLCLVLVLHEASLARRLSFRSSAHDAWLPVLLPQLSVLGRWLSRATTGGLIRAS